MTDWSQQGVSAPKPETYTICMWSPAELTVTGRHQNISHPERVVWTGKNGRKKYKRGLKHRKEGGVKESAEKGGTWVRLRIHICLSWLHTASPKSTLLMFFLNWRRYLVWRLVECSTLDDRSASCGWTFACLLLLLLLGPYHTNLPPCTLMGWLCGDSMHACRGPQHVNPEGMSSPRAWCDSSEIKKTKSKTHLVFVCLFVLSDKAKNRCNIWNTYFSW